MAKAARLSDPIGHSPSMSWLVKGLLIGAAVAVAGVAIAGTGGLAAAAIIGGAAAGGAGIGELMSTMSWAPKEIAGAILGACSANVFTNNKPAARAHLDLVACEKHSGTPPIASGSDNVFINDQPAARVGDKTGCGGDITDGSGDVFIGGGTTQTDAIHPEDLVPGWVHAALFAVGAAAATVLAGPIVATAGLVGGLAGGAGGGWLGGRLWGEGSDGQKWAMLGGSLVGGALGAKGGLWFDKNYTVTTEGLGSNFGNVKIRPRPVTNESAPPQGLPDWLKARFEAGNEFNRVNRARYPCNEVEVIDPLGNKFRVDSYDPVAGEIVSRKFSQLGDIKPETGIQYLQELARKYPAGATISDSPFNPRILQGSRLSGDLILEVPVQRTPVPDAVLDYANKNGIIIRDVSGEIY